LVNGLRSAPLKRATRWGNRRRASRSSELSRPLSYYAEDTKPEPLLRFSNAVNVRLRLRNLTALQAISADAHPLGCAVHTRAHRPQINVPAAIAHVVRMRNVVAELRLLAANITNLCHGSLQISSEL